MFQFATAGKILFGRGMLATAATEAAALGRKALVVTGRRSDRVLPLLDDLTSAGVAYELFHVEAEPTVDLARKATAVASESECDLVVGFGGGSVIDLAKAVAALLTNTEDPLYYLEVVGQGQPLANPPVPSIAIPTTAGTGAEVTKNAVLASPEHQVKVSMRHPLMFPNVAVVDPVCMRSMPRVVTASTGLDALTQLLEAFISSKANPLTDGFCREGLPRAVRSLRRACENGDDLVAREEMALAALFGGMALANAGLGAVHGFAGPLGGMFDAPHGLVCAALLPHVMEVNLEALVSRCPEAPALGRFAEFAELCTEMAGSSAEDGVAWLSELCRDLEVPSLTSFGISEADVEAITEKAKAASSMKGNPVVLTDDELFRILRQAL
jgi:alcohol dehydrogenase class IV